jgi:N-methylhydantoinase A
MLAVEAGTGAKLAHVFTEMKKLARATLQREGFPVTRQKHEQLLAMRYQGQSFELEIESSQRDMVGAFHKAHRLRYGYAQERNAVEIVSARLRSLGLVERIITERPQPGSKRNSSRARKHVAAHVGGKSVRVAVYQREELPAGAVLRTPCIVVEYSATTLVPTRARAKVDDFGNLIIDV